MSFASTTLRPGLLVGLSTSIRGNVEYVKTTIEEDHATGTGARRAKWETERTIIDPVEFEAATKIRSRARSIVASVCAVSAFGFLCPENSALELEKALAEARKICDDFNRTSNLTRIYFNAITGRIAPDDVSAVRAINGEVRELLSEMEEGIQNLDVKMVRNAADRAKQLGSMLTPNAQARIQIAIDAARKVATKMVKAGEQAAVEIDRRTLTTLSEARTAFLDLDEAGTINAPAHEARAIDLEPGVNYDAANATGNFNDAGNFKPAGSKPKARKAAELEID
jgi:hypothetical protein